MTRSFSTLKNVILTASFALLPFAAVNASAQNAARVNIPFGFMANHHYVPAGTYSVLPSENAVTLINADTRKAEAILLIRKEAGDVIESRGRLEFYVSGSRHVLVEAQFAGSSMHSKLLGQPKQERVAASNSQPTGTMVELAMR
jgi:hypothetical protein